MVQTRVLREIGALDPHYRSFYEEVDLCRRARWAGYRVALLLDAFVEHAGGTDGGVSRYRNFHMTRNRNLYLLTDPRIPFRTATRLMARWLVDDAVTQRRAVRGTVTDTGELVAAWLSVARSARWARATRRRNARLAGASA